MPTNTRKARQSKSVPVYAAPALDKGLDILELLARQPAGLTKSQLARELNRTISEIFRMLVSLEQRGYIAQLAEDRYSLTLKLFQLAQEHPATERLIVDSYPVMQRLAAETLQSCHLGVLQSRSIVILVQNNAPQDVGFYVKLGSTVDLLEAASGYVILAHQDAAHRQSILTGWCEASGQTPPDDLEIHLKRIRKAGFEKRSSYLVKGVVNISFPVLNHQGSAVAALTIPFIQYIHKTPSMEQTIECLRSAAAEITAAIGGGRFVP
jgi:DNA-binding IclR family transcriptional regulator